MNREIQGIIRYDRTNDDENRPIMLPRFECGFARNWQGSINVPVYAGNADRMGNCCLPLPLQIALASPLRKR